MDVLGVGVSAICMDDALSAIDDCIAAGRREYVCVTPVHGIMESQRSEELRGVYRRAALVTPDGMPLVWLCRWAGHRDASRVYGPDLLLAEMERSAGSSRRHFFIGGGPGVVDDLVERLEQRFPGLHVVGKLTPPKATVSALCGEEIVEAINTARPDIVWVGLGLPKQELWMAAMRDRLEAPLLIGIGAAFDIHAGRLPQAPRWMQRSGLEWFFRLTREPKRLWRRYLLYNPWFILAVAAQQMGLRRGQLPADASNP